MYLCDRGEDLTGAPGNPGRPQLRLLAHLSTCWLGSREDHTVPPPAHHHTSARRHTHRPVTPSSLSAAGLGLCGMCVCVFVCVYEQ